jgi:predicted nuclease with RNAse H fold
MKTVGIDLAGKEENPSGICSLNNNEIILKTLYTDEEILDYVKRINPSIIAIDAPLSLPKGRCCLEKDCQCAVGGHFRQAERDIRPYGRVLPLTFRGMKMLTLRGISLAKELRKDYQVIETHPRTSQKMLGFKDPSDLSRFYKLREDATEHELDAALAAVTGLLYLKDCYLELGDPDEGTIVIPKKMRN